MAGPQVVGSDPTLDRVRTIGLGTDFQTYTRFYRLIWQPAACMHHGWWYALTLDQWRPVYQSNANARCRRWINYAIAVRRGFPVPGAPYMLDPVERQLISASERLPLLLLALGLLRLGRPEYWMLKPYRTALLQKNFDHITCTQLAVFAAASAPAGFRIQAPLLEPTQVADAAQTQGMAILASALPNSVVLRAIEILFTPQTCNGNKLEKTVASFGLNVLFKLARFL